MLEFDRKKRKVHENLMVSIMLNDDISIEHIIDNNEIDIFYFNEDVFLLELIAHSENNKIKELIADNAVDKVEKDFLGYLSGKRDVVATSLIYDLFNEDNKKALLVEIIHRVTNASEKYLIKSYSSIFKLYRDFCNSFFSKESVKEVMRENTGFFLENIEKDFAEQNTFLVEHIYKNFDKEILADWVKENFKIKDNKKYTSLPSQVKLIVELDLFDQNERYVKDIVEKLKDRPIDDFYIVRNTKFMLSEEEVDYLLISRAVNKDLRKNQKRVKL